MIELQNSRKASNEQSGIAAFFESFVAKVRYSVSSFFCIKQQEPVDRENENSASKSPIEDELIEFTVTAKQPKKPKRQLKFTVRKGELMKAKCVGNKTSSMFGIIRKNLTDDQFHYFKRHCIKRYELAFDKSCIFIYFLFLRVMLELNQISRATFDEVYKLLQKSLWGSIHFYKEKGHRYNSHRKVVNSIILGQYLNLSQIPLWGGEYKVVVNVFSSFFVNKSSLSNCLDKIKTVIDDHLCLSNLFSDLK